MVLNIGQLALDANLVLPNTTRLKIVCHARYRHMLAQILHPPLKVRLVRYLLGLELERG